MKSRNPIRAGWRRWVVLLSFACCVEAVAVEVPTLYTAEVPFDRRADNPRGDAYAAALVEILMRVSGSRLAANKAAVDELFPNPASYVTQFRPGSDDTLWVSFDGQAIERVLRDSGQTFWGADRPLTVVWLAVDWGQGTREIIAADDPGRSQHQSRSIDRNRMVRERLLEIARRRGLPIAFPLLDTTDLQSVTFTDIWGGFDDAVIEASERYDARSILIGRIRPGTSQRDRWSYYFGGVETTLSGSPEVVLGQVADRLAAEFAIVGDAPVETVVLNVSGIVSVEAYASVQAILRDIALIEGFSISAVSGDRVTYRIEVRGGAGRLGRALRFGGLVEQEAGDAFQPGTLEFFFGP